MSALRHPIFGVVLAGGGSSRFGSPKAQAILAGRTLLSRALGILGVAGLDTGVIANRASDLPGRVRWDSDGRGWVSLPDSVGGAREVPVRADLKRGAGPLGGLHSALRWAAERGDAGVFLLGCDMPLVPSELVGRVSRSFDETRPVAPASDGPLGVEPLCAVYPVSLVATLEERLAAGQRAMGDLLSTVDHAVLTRDELGSAIDPILAFLNVNTPEDRERAEKILLAAGPSAGESRTQGERRRP